MGGAIPQCCMGWGRRIEEARRESPERSLEPPKPAAARARKSVVREREAASVAAEGEIESVETRSGAAPETGGWRQRVWRRWRKETRGGGLRETGAVTHKRHEPPASAMWENRKR